MCAEANQPFADGPLTIIPAPNGPLKCMGAVAVSGASGQRCECYDQSLCRCGKSATKPFCDGSHDKTGFVA